MPPTYSLIPLQYGRLWFPGAGPVVWPRGGRPGGDGLQGDPCQPSERGQVAPRHTVYTPPGAILSRNYLRLVNTTLYDNTGGRGATLNQACQEKSSKWNRMMSHLLSLSIIKRKKKLAQYVEGSPGSPSMSSQPRSLFALSNS